MKFRSHIPENCPAEDADVSSGSVYRMVKDNPSPEDFLSFRELKPDKAYLSECIASGLSVYTDAEGIRRLRSRVPRFRKMNVALGELDENHGKMKTYQVACMNPIIHGGWQRISNHGHSLR